MIFYPRMIKNKTVKELYISVDIEADGPIPSNYSMTALGAVVAGYLTVDGQVVKFDVTAPQNRFYAEIRPISDDWIPAAMKVGVFEGFGKEEILNDVSGEKQRAYLMEQGEDPAEAMTRFAAWVEEKKLEHETSNAVFAAYPVGFDWMFAYWYLINFSTIGSPFGHARHIDIKTLFMVKSKTLIVQSVKSRMPKFLHSKLKHTHMAVQDAAEQGELLMNILEWEPER